MIFLCCGFADLKIAIGILDASADFLLKTKRIFMVPLLYFGVTLVAFLLWLLSFACIQTVGQIVPDINNEIPQYRETKL